jgi:cell division GTPase FtsZ
MDKYKALTAALEKAKEAALKYADTEDGGTCNFDSPTIDYRAMHMKKSKAEEAIKAADLRCFDWNGYGGIRLVVCGLGYGQGNRKTRMAEAAHESLKADGIECGMYYQMD